MQAPTDRSELISAVSEHLNKKGTIYGTITQGLRFRGGQAKHGSAKSTDTGLGPGGRGSRGSVVILGNYRKPIETGGVRRVEDGAAKVPRATSMVAAVASNRDIARNLEYDNSVSPREVRLLRLP